MNSACQPPRWIALMKQLSIGWLLSCLVMSCGCSASGGAARPVVGTCRVTVDGQVLQDVRVALFQEGATEPLMEGTSDATGVVALKLVEGAQLPSDGSVKLKATVESLGDWEIIAPWSSVEKSPLRVDYSSNVDMLQIELPQKALRAL